MLGVRSGLLVSSLALCCVASTVASAEKAAPTAPMPPPVSQSEIDDLVEAGETAEREEAAEAREEAGREAQEAAEAEEKLEKQRERALERGTELPPIELDELGAPPVCSGPYDWLRFTSGEWLRGELYRMRSRRVEYKSKEVKKLTIKWKKVAELCLPRPMRFVLGKRVTVVGPGRLAGDTLVVQTATGERVIDRREVVAILSGEASEWNNWTASASLGLDVHTGNTDQTSVHASAAVVREDRLTRSRLGYSGSHGTANDKENVLRHRLEAKGDVYVSRRFYVTAVDSSFTYDKFQNLALRATPTSGFGYQIFDHPDVEWDVEAGLGYQYTRYLSVAAGQAIDEGDLVTRLSTDWRWDVTGDLEWKVDHTTILVPTSFGQTNYFTRSVLSYDLNDFLKFDFTFVHSRVEEPVPNEDGTVPKRDDMQTIFSFSIELR